MNITDLLDILVESKYELIAHEPQTNCKKTFYDVFLYYCV